MVNWQGDTEGNSRGQIQDTFSGIFILEISKNHETTPGYAGEPVEFRADDPPYVS